MTDVFVMVLWGDRDARFRVLDMMACSREATELPLAQRQLASPYMHELLTALRPAWVCQRLRRDERCCEVHAARGSSRREVEWNICSYSRQGTGIN